VTTLALAFTAGLLATVNPCGFAMLPAFLAFYLGASDPGQPRGVGAPAADRGRVGHGLAVGLAVSSGFAGVFVAAALLAAAGLTVLVRVVPWAALGIGLALVGLGGWLLAGRHLGLTVPSRLHPQAGRSYRRVVAFGGAYALASLSCTLGVLLALVGQALATADPLRLAGVFAGYAAGAASVLVGVSVSVALVGRVRRLLPLAGRLGGGLLVVSGAYLIAFWAPTLARAGSPTRPAALVEVGTALSARLAGLLLAGQGLVAVLGGVLAASGLALTIRSRRRASRHLDPATHQARGGGPEPASPSRSSPGSSDPPGSGT
jgi:cytochrome c biogenesis protein CcdA